MPKSSKVCGMGGLNPLWAGESVAAMKDIEPHSLYRPNRDICLLADGMGLHACGPRTVNPLVKVCWSILLLLIGCWIPLSAASQAEQLFHQAQKAEHDGEIVKAYLLYAEAAAANPTNIDYWSRAQALRPAASLMGPSPAKAPLFGSEKIDRTLFGTITDTDLEQAQKPLPPAVLEAEPGRHDYNFQGDSKELWKQVAATLHLKVLFDADYKPT